MENSKTIETAINNWTINRPDSTAIISFLNQGSCFEIQRNDTMKWKLKNPEFIHAYPAIFDGVLKFVLVDDVTDSDPNIDYDYVFTKDYTYGAPPTNVVDVPGSSNISIEDALQRVFRWSMTKDNWVINNCRSTNGVFQAFHIPASDLYKLFEDTTGDCVYVVIGLILDPVTRIEIPDMILWNELTIFVDPAMVQDVALPVPPFGVDQPETNYQLLLQSNP